MESLLFNPPHATPKGWYPPQSTPRFGRPTDRQAISSASVYNPADGVAQRLEYELEKFTVKVQFLSPAVRSAGLVLPGEFDLIDPIYWVVATAVTALFVVNSFDGGGPSGTDPTPPPVSPDGDDPDKWKRYLKWAAVAVGVIVGVAAVVYLANRYGTTPGGGTPPPSPPGTPPITGPINTTADLIQRLNRGGGTPAELEQTLRDLAGGPPPRATPSAGISWAQVAELVNRPGGEPPVVVRPRPHVVDRPSQWIIQDPQLARAFESGDRIAVLPNPVVQGEWRHLVWMHPTELNALAKNHPGWDYRPTSRVAAGRYCMKWAYQDVFTTDDRQHESFKSIAIQHAAHRFGILESEYPGWCRYYRTRFEEVGPEEVALFKERTKEMFIRNGGAHPLALYHRSLENWEMQRDHLAEGFAFEYKQRYR